MKRIKRTLWILGTMVFFVGRSIQADPLTNSAVELTKLSLEDLMQIEVTSVSRAPEKASSAPAAITVITAEDIRRSGVTSIPEALRMAPGLDVARVDSHTWAISSRGFNDIFANKLLVMMDGRTVYTPLFSGVFWDVQDTMLEDIERIEVVRGPGATLWGANAVNGVINIITKSAKDTQGLLVSGGAGTEERAFGGVRYGVKINDETHLRVYTKYFNRDDQALANGREANDSGEMIRGGFRLDWRPSEMNLFTLQSDVYSGALNNVYTLPSLLPPFVAMIPNKVGVAGGNLLGRWTHTFSESSEMTIQTYYDRTVRRTVVLDEDRDTGDIDLQHRFDLGERQAITWGGGFRVTSDSVENTGNISLNPIEESVNLYSAFVQDEIILQPEHWFFTAGTKLEHNDYTGFEIQPSGRLSWKPEERQTVWASISRAVRTPSRVEQDITFNPAGAPPGFATIRGNRNLGPEKLVAYEIGYRVQPYQRLSIDIAAFYNDYENLRNVEPTGFLANTRISNQFFGETYGYELTSTFQALEQWRLHAGYTFLQMQLHARPGAGDASPAERQSPQNQAFLRSTIDLGRHVEFDQTLRYVDSIVVTTFGTSMNVPSYFSLDLRLAWRPTPNWELALVGQNLLDNQHPEFYPTFVGTQRTEVERGVYGKLTWRF